VNFAVKGTARPTKTPLLECYFESSSKHAGAAGAESFKKAAFCGMQSKRHQFNLLILKQNLKEQENGPAGRYATSQFLPAPAIGPARTPALNVFPGTWQSPLALLSS